MFMLDKFETNLTMCVEITRYFSNVITLISIIVKSYSAFFEMKMISDIKASD